ncbi:hypothetical protein ATANTOWER_003189 [Ataeniobius toweri]|uniref:Uncharacterized protein n=1 Tax=Ataeniobius toweri TaxID=208326 RepID=A0ABU7B6Y5_9TELE|nr:hypothetical protein [Ataeniobius toweri]
MFQALMLIPAGCISPVRDPQFTCLQNFSTQAKREVSCSQEIDHSRLRLVRSAHPSLVSFPALILFTSG